jgi:uncharacterized tellurite resistance protein B-like protein
MMVLMSIRKWLGLAAEAAPVNETEIVRKVVAELDHLPPERARYTAAFGYLLGRVAHADLHISDAETSAMERLVGQHGQLPPEQAAIVVHMAKANTQLLGGTENFLVTRQFQRIATRDELLQLLDCLFAVSAAEGDISVPEDNEIRQIASELGLDHREFIQVRAAWKDRLSVMKDLPNPTA